MPSELDLRLTASSAALSAADGMMPVKTISVDGVDLKAIDLPFTTLPEYFSWFCKEHSDATFLVDGAERLTYGEVYDLASRTAAGLIQGYDVQRGDRVGIAMRNSPSWIALYMAVLMAGGTVTLLNGWWETEELAKAVLDVDCSLVFADAPRARRLEKAGLAQRVLEIEDSAPLAQALAAITGKASDPATLPSLDGLDGATILFTSGSTGTAKGAFSNHRAVLQGVLNFLSQSLAMKTLSLEDGNYPEGQLAALMNLPLFHVTAEVPMLLQSFPVGRKLVLMRKWDAEEAMRLIEAESVTHFLGVPLMSYEILTHPRRAEYNLSKVVDYVAGGAPRPVDHVRRIREEMGGGYPTNGYGLTETNAAGTSNWRENYLAKPASVGRASPLAELAVFDSTSRKVATGEIGEIGIRSITNFQFYWGRPDETAAAFTPDRFFLTGDVGYLDEDGYLFIVDRKKDIIIRGGENISCQEVEAAIYRQPLVAECTVFGLPDERFGEVVGAVVRYRDEAVLQPDELIAFLRPHIAAFKLPCHVWTSTEPLPRLGTEKIDKSALRTFYRNQLTNPAGA